MLAVPPLLACGARTGFDFLGSPALDGGGSASTDAGTAEASGPPAPCGTTPLTLASAQPDPVDLAVDATSVTWTTQPLGQPSLGGVFRAPIAGGQAEVTTLAQNQGYPLSVVVDATNAYWTDQWNGNISQAPLAGGTVKVLVDGLGQNGPGYLAVDATSVYWANFGDDEAATGSISRASLAGGPQLTLASSQAQPWQVAIDSDFVYWIDIDEADDGGGSVMRARKDGHGSPVTLASSQHLPEALALDADTVYFANGGTHAGNFLDGAVLSVPKAGGAVTTLAAAQQAVLGVAADGTDVYWVVSATRNGDGAVRKVARTGGTPVTLATAQQSPAAIAVDAQCVYWLNAGSGANDEDDGAVMMMAK